MWTCGQAKSWPRDPRKRSDPYGADVINRIIESMKPGGRKKLQDAGHKGNVESPDYTDEQRAGNKSRMIYRMCVAGNTTMNHLLVGVDADPIRMEPYIPTFFETTCLHARIWESIFSPMPG